MQTILRIASSAIISFLFIIIIIQLINLYLPWKYNFSPLCCYRSGKPLYNGDSSFELDELIDKRL